MPDYYRWVICALLFFATTINYIDRQVLGILAPTLQTEIGWKEKEYGAIVSWFTVAYALGFLGRRPDHGSLRHAARLLGLDRACGASPRWRTRWRDSATGFGVARFALGLGESGNFPGAIKTVAEWFPARERAFATGIFNARLERRRDRHADRRSVDRCRWGWRAAFIVIGALGFVWLVVWLACIAADRAPAGIGRGARAHPERCRPSRRRPVRWLQLLRHRQTWAFAIGKFLTDPIWWFYLYWLPKFLDTRYGIKLSQVARADHRDLFAGRRRARSVADGCRAPSSGVAGR